MIIQKKSYAKINLYLEILDKLPSGYHNIYTVMHKISLCDDITIEIRAGKPGIEIFCDDKNVPTDKTNTAYKAASLFFGQIGMPPCVNITIEKKIPCMAGLGGGSSNAAAVLSALNEYYNSTLPENIMLEIAAKTGADVPFFVKNANCAVCEGIGEIVTPVYSDLSGYYCLILKPAYNISTKKAFADFDRRLAAEKGTRAAVGADDPVRPQIFTIHNDFEKIIFEQHKDVGALKSLLLKSGALSAGMSGSGSALFGVFENFQAAQKCADRISVSHKNIPIEFCGVFEFLS